MDIPVERWYPCIAERTSRRNFDGRLPEEEKLARLERVCREFRPFPECRAELVREPATGVFKGILGSYGRVTGAPSYIAFIGDMNSARVQECLGYTGEGLILEAAALGLGTCWVGGFFRPGVVAGQVRLGASEKIIAVSPVGTAPPKLRFSDRTIKVLAGSKGRKSLRELLLGDPIPDEKILKGLEAARLAPSAVNRQPWRFLIDADSITISPDRPEKHPFISLRLDCGIAMLHLELGLRSAGMTGSWEFLPAPDVARFKFDSAGRGRPLSR